MLDKNQVNEQFLPLKEVSFYYQVTRVDDGILITVDEAVSELTGYTVDEFIEGVYADRYIHPDFLSELKDSQQRAFEEKSKYNLDYKFKCKDGSFLTLNDSGAPILDSDGNVVAIVGSVRRSLLKDSRLLYLFNLGNIIQQAHKVGELGVFFMNVESQKMYWSEQMKNIHGLEAEPTLDSYMEIIHPDDLEDSKVANDRLFNHGKGFRRIYKIYKGADKIVRTLFTSCEPVYNEQSEMIGVSGTTVDVTDILGIVLAQSEEFRVNKTNAEKEDINQLFVRHEGKLISIKVEDISVISAFGDYVKIFYGEKSQPIIIYKTLKELLNILSKDLFVQIHRSHIVQVRFIKEVNVSTVVVKEMELPLSRTFRASVLQKVYKI